MCILFSDLDFSKIIIMVIIGQIKNELAEVEYFIHIYFIWEPCFLRFNQYQNIHAAAAAAKSLQSCLSLCDPIYGSPPDSAVPGILQGDVGGLPLPSPTLKVWIKLKKSYEFKK